MEKITMLKNSAKHGFKKGETFAVKRNVNGECVIICGGCRPNIVMTERRARSYGRLCGKP